MVMVLSHRPDFIFSSLANALEKMKSEQSVSFINFIINLCFYLDSSVLDTLKQEKVSHIDCTVYSHFLTE